MRWSGLDETNTTRLLMTPRRQSIRINPLSNDQTDLSPHATPVSWCSNGYSPLDSATDILPELALSGKLYIQNAASWLPVLALDPQPNDIILDVCAAPGGKASHIQAITHNQSKLACNDNSKPRLMKLRTNMQRLGAEASYTLCDATRLANKFSPGTFSKILLDAPCSGEGLMTLRPEDEKLFDTWSVAHIRRLSDLQKNIICKSWKLLQPGGTLVYSTCTMAPEENEAVIDYFLRKHTDAKLEPVTIPLQNRFEALHSWNGKPFQNDLSSCLRLLPSQLTEAFFVAKLIKPEV